MRNKKTQNFRLISEFVDTIINNMDGNNGMIYVIK